MLSNFFPFIRAEELETALMEMVKQDNRRQLSAKVRLESIRDFCFFNQYMFCAMHIFCICCFLIVLLQREGDFLLSFQSGSRNKVCFSYSN